MDPLGLSGYTVTQPNHGVDLSIAVQLGFRALGVQGFRAQGLGV